ncbi:hypothetical protein Atai01_35840 [Amycolatopsis taiwanensis]|uniref:Uncharacterized protein n=1 Tax=Amycolatopsis taiwanensis TaxID=342230 RepID=A0A9W6VFN2_9PSEU|nr:hypothetical protein Atai01_35840 [Amycolatopsis taiwanensis]
MRKDLVDAPAKHHVPAQQDRDHPDEYPSTAGTRAGTPVPGSVDLRPANKRARERELCGVPNAIRFG